MVPTFSKVIRMHGISLGLSIIEESVGLTDIKGRI